MRLPAEARKGIAPLLRSLVEGNGRLDSLLAQREKKLRAADPRRLPVYQFQGREFQIDPRKGTRTFLDAPDTPERLEVEVVHTKEQPDPGRAPRRSRDRERGRMRAAL